LENDTSYELTVIGEFKKRFQREISLQSSQRKAFKWLQRLAYYTALKPRDIRKHGLSCVKWGFVQKEARDELNQGRMDLELPPLSVKLHGGVLAQVY
jgi:hypothetical protein